MIIYLFDEGPVQREKIYYDTAYENILTRAKALVESAIDTVELFHTGSTAIPGLRGKPMNDIAAVSTKENLRSEQEQFLKPNFDKRDIWVGTDEKPYVCGSVALNGSRCSANLHICHQGDWIHKQGLRFVGALKTRADLRRKYEIAKDKAHAIEPSGPERYNRAREQAINEIYEQIDS